MTNLLIIAFSGIISFLVVWAYVNIKYNKDCKYENTSYDLNYLRDYLKFKKRPVKSDSVVETIVLNELYNDSQQSEVLSSCYEWCNFCVKKRIREKEEKDKLAILQAAKEIESIVINKIKNKRANKIAATKAVKVFLEKKNADKV